MNQQALSSFIWSVADLLRGDYKQSDYGKVILPLIDLLREKRQAVISHAVTKGLMVTWLRRPGVRTWLATR